MIGATAASANLPGQLAKYEAFAEGTRKLGLHAIEKSIRLVLPMVRNNVYWRQHRYDELSTNLQALLKSLNLP